jgi:hypothetical protein
LQLTYLHLEPGQHLMRQIIAFEVGVLVRQDQFPEEAGGDEKQDYKRGQFAGLLDSGARKRAKGQWQVSYGSSISRAPSDRNVLWVAAPYPVLTP